MSRMKTKEPQLAKFIKIETFENYNVKEMFGNLDDKGFEFARKGKKTTKDCEAVAKGGARRRTGGRLRDH